MGIQFDYANLMAEMVGAEHGLSRRQIEEARPSAARALASFREKSESGRYGFPHLPFQGKIISEVEKFAAGRRGRFETVCLIGIGGSALGAWALDCALRGPHPVQKKHTGNNPRLVILDNVDPALVSAALDSMNPRRTMALVITKSGSTAESISTFLVVRDWLRKAVGKGGLAARVAVVTGPEPAEGAAPDLLQMARREGYPAFFVPPNVGGRFSVLSPVGLLPAAILGIDVRRLCAGAREMTGRCWKSDLEENPALLAALLHWLLLERHHKTIQVAFSYSSLLWGLAFWFRQLWAESLGKEGRGQTPVAALGVTDQHSQAQLYLEGPNDKVISLWAAGAHRTIRIPKDFSDLGSAGYLGGRTMGALFDAEQRATAAALARQGRPNCTFTLARVDGYHVGAFVQLMEFEVAFIGELMGIDAFTQPGVELGKRLTYALMGRKGYEAHRTRFDEYEQARARALA